MKPKLLTLVATAVCMLVYAPNACAQNAYAQQNNPRWVVQKPSYSMHSSTSAQMDDDRAMEMVVLFSRDIGHYPHFDLYQVYYIVFDQGSQEILYASNEMLTTAREIVVQDRNTDGKAELYIRYIAGDNFSVDQRGENLSAKWAYDVISLPLPAPVVMGNGTSWSDAVPNPRLLTHLNYALGHVNDSFDGVDIDWEYPSPANRIIRTLIVAGQDGHHWWMGGAFALEEMLVNSGAFKTDIEVEPHVGGDFAAFAPDFSRYDLVVVYCGGEGWSKRTRKSFDRFVSRGGGVVMVHQSPEQSGTDVAGISPVSQRPFNVAHRVPDHPVLRGLPTVWTHFKDELHSQNHALVADRNVTVIATAWSDPESGGSGRHEPVLWCAKQGRGRVFVTTMGHAGSDPELYYSMECAGFQETLLRGAEWAATGSVTRPVPHDLPGEGVSTIRPRFNVEQWPLSGTPLPVRMRWDPSEITITANGDEPLESGWEIWFNGPVCRTAHGFNSPVRVTTVGSLSKITTTPQYRPLLHGESITIPWGSPVASGTQATPPEGAFMVAPDRGQPIPLEVETPPTPTPNNGRAAYERNRDAAMWRPGQNDILPLPKTTTHIGGSTRVSNNIVLEYPGLFVGEADFLAETLIAEFGAHVVPAAPRQRAITAVNSTTIRLVHEPRLFDTPRPEGYKIRIENGGITITAQKSAGVFYGVQTLLAILRNKALPLSLADVEITDWPDSPVRGQLIDVAHNFLPAADMMKLIDIFAAYKLNTLVWHLADDTGWRLEIRGLPELTEVGARRGYTTHETDMLLPAHGDGPYPDQGTGSGFVTRAQFIDMIRYAAQRHVTIVPEIVAPGHARAARVAMNARFNRLINSAPVSAREFLLHDFADRSVYLSPEGYVDNVMNVAMPSTWRFIETVVDEIALMYSTAKVPLEVIHTGDHDTPDGAWSVSPAAELYMAQYKIPGVEALPRHYTLRLNSILKAHGIKMAMRSGAAGAGAAGMGVDADLGDNLAWVNRADGTIVDRNGHTIGRQGELWSQSVRGFNATTRTLFPATLGVVEQAWNERPMWSGPDYSRFAAAVAVREMPWLSALGLDVHLPPPGIYVENGLLIANSPIKGAEIRYTTDGSTPTRESTLWTEPVECNAYIITARLFYLGHESENSFFL